MVGGLLFGYLADKYGRKPVMLVTLYLPILIGLGIAFSNNYYLFVALRFLMGMLLQVRLLVHMILVTCCLVAQPRFPCKCKIPIHSSVEKIKKSQEFVLLINPTCIYF
jgi:hypothetical protein